MFLRERKASGSGTPGSEKSASPALLVIIGLLSGILCGLFGVSALLVAYVSRTAGDQSQFRANNCMVFLAENTFRLFLYGSTGILTLEAAKTALCLAPLMVLASPVFRKNTPGMEPAITRRLRGIQIFGRIPFRSVQAIHRLEG